jgi:hypothetical protein
LEREATMPRDPRLDPDEGARSPDEVGEVEAPDEAPVASSDPDSPGLAATVVQRPDQDDDA